MPGVPILGSLIGYRYPWISNTPFQEGVLDFNISPTSSAKSQEEMCTPEPWLGNAQGLPFPCSRPWKLTVVGLQVSVDHRHQRLTVQVVHPTGNLHSPVDQHMGGHAPTSQGPAERPTSGILHH